MRIWGLIGLTMAAFAANSVLNRAAVGGGAMGAMDFAVLRLWSGALTLVILARALRGGPIPWVAPGRAAGVLGLSAYLARFSWAYLSLDAGLGALILFGTVQITMFGGGLLRGERPPVRRWIGAGIALSGLGWLLWPGGGAAVSLPHAVAMAVAGLGWGVYSLAGQAARDPLRATAANFVLAAPLGLLVLALPGGIDPGGWQAPGIVLAVASGALASGLGYALWYHVLPQIAGSVAAVAQLTVPILALAGGVLFLGEGVTPAFLLAAVVVLGGVAVSVLPIGRR